MIVMGASLGGTKAAGVILRSLPRDFPQPIALALHRHREPDDALLQWLQRESALPVLEPQDKEPLLPGRVYLAPADYHLLVETSCFSLSTDEPEHFARPSIDVLFESAADAFGPETAALVLTGGGVDGAEGARCICSRGGIVLVQDPATAECAAMPQAALEATGTPHVYALEEMAPFLLKWAADVRSP